MTMKTTVLTSLASICLLLAACAPTGPKKQDSERDIYAALTNNEIQYRSQDNAPEQDNASTSAFAVDQIEKIRNLYFRKKLAEAADEAERLLRIDSQQPEAYYWLARIRMDQGDFSSANELANKGLRVVYDENLKRELERVQGITQMGAQ